VTLSGTDGLCGNDTGLRRVGGSTRSNSNDAKGVGLSGGEFVHIELSLGPTIDLFEPTISLLNFQGEGCYGNSAIVTWLPLHFEVGGVDFSL
jgi:hypothetical protein